MSPNPTHRLLKALETGGFNPRRSGTGWAARCPGHDDHVASLSVSETEEGRVLVHCHAGCALADILGKVGLAARDLFERAAPSPSVRYQACDATGAVIATHVRQDGSNGKRMWWERNGKRTLGGLRVKALPLYRSERVARDSGPILLVEGEKACDALRDHGFPAVGTVCGASSTPSAESLAVLRGRDVIMWPDNDGPGRGHMHRIAEGLAGVAAAVKVFNWPEAPEHGDAADYFAAGATAESLLAALADAAPVPKPGSETATAKQAQPSARRQGRELVLADPEPWDQPVDGASLANAMAAALHQFVVLPPHACVAVMLWVLHAHALDAYQVSPLLVASSPVKRCGKTTLLHLLSALVPRPLMTSNVSPAALYRTVEKYQPTLLVDEADSFLKLSDELRGLLNSGHTRAGAQVVRTVGESFEPCAFSTWGAKVVALIGRLPDTLEGRAVVVSMARRAPGEQVARLRIDRLTELGPLRSQAARWAKDSMEQLRAADPDVPPRLDDRAGDNWRPLMAVAEVLGGAWPARAREAALALAGLAPETESAGEMLLADLKALFAERGSPEQLPSETVVADLLKLEDRRWPEWRDGKPLTKTGLARILKPFGIEPRSIRDGGGRVVRGYVLGDLQDAFARYLPPEVLQPLQGASGAGESTTLEVLPREPVADRETPSPPRHLPFVAVVADQRGAQGEHRSAEVTGPIATFLASVGAAT